MSETLDRRLNAFRGDLADKRLEGQVDGDRFVDGQPAEIKAHFADVHRQPDLNSGLDTQILHGQRILVFDRKDGWAWIQSNDDGYVGYVQEDDLGELGETKTHMVLAPRTFLYSRPDMKSPRCGYRSMGSEISVVDQVTMRDTDYLILDSNQAIIAKHVIDIGDWQSDPVSVAETLLHTPYLWGGNTAFGIDCSGLVTISNRLCGIKVLRDSDMQASTIGQEIPFDLGALQRGDLIFWNGHVGMMADQNTLLHANGNTMDVAQEKLEEAVRRIGHLYGQPTMARRP